MSRSKLFGIALSAVMAICPQLPIGAQIGGPGGGGGKGPCTNYGCISFPMMMAPIRWAGVGLRQNTVWDLATNSVLASFEMILELKADIRREFRAGR